jgi:hypothetical protein
MWKALLTGRHLVLQDLTLQKFGFQYSKDCNVFEVKFEDS